MKEKKVLINLMQWWPPHLPREEQYDLYEAIKDGTKTSEYRDAIDHWTKRLFKKGDLSEPKVNRIWLVVGYPKGSLPRLEADIKRILVSYNDWGDPDQYEIQFENVVEVLE